MGFLMELYNSLPVVIQILLKIVLILSLIHI